MWVLNISFCVVSSWKLVNVLLSMIQVTIVKSLMVAIVQLQFHKTSFATMAESHFSPKLCVSLFFCDFHLATVGFLVLNTLSISQPGCISTSLSTSPPDLFCWSENGSSNLSSESISIGSDVTSAVLAGSASMGWSFGSFVVSCLATLGFEGVVLVATAHSAFYFLVSFQSASYMWPVMVICSFLGCTKNFLATLLCDMLVLKAALHSNQ